MKDIKELFEKIYGIKNPNKKQIEIFVESLKRRLTIREAARLQSFPDSFIFDSNDHQAYKQFGNAVNVNVIKTAAEALFNYKESE